MGAVMTDAAIAGVTLDERINTLFRAWRRQGEPEQTNDEVAAALTAAGTTLTGGDLEDLRAGIVSDADPAVLSAIARHFRTPAEYLTGDDILETHEQLLLLERMAQLKVRSILLRGERTAADRRALIETLKPQSASGNQ